MYYVYLFLFFFVPIYGGCRCCIIWVILMFVSHKFSLFWFSSNLAYRITHVTVGPQSLIISFWFYLCDLFPQIAWVIREDWLLGFQIDRSTINKPQVELFLHLNFGLFYTTTPWKFHQAKLFQSICFYILICCCCELDIAVGIDFDFGLWNKPGFQNLKYSDSPALV